MPRQVRKSEIFFYLWQKGYVNYMRVYADNAATTRMSEVAIKAMMPYMSEVYGNPSSLHSIGQEAKEH